MKPKLVRDLIPEIIKNDGSTPRTHIASDEEYEQKLKEKLQEEVDEFLQNPSAEELADILEVIHALRDHKFKDVESLRQKKAEERGSFKNKIILNKIE